ncbi:ribokinase [Salibacterium halotolerans]|uniref:Ribokinase n=1 Tax=Salibacterium halotolerans TaxID=1884432 RepID=A0A1I5TN15_9BACI|nr:ribokinase [Salibacterium halotolerans]SFP84007.1 ribokinase [Salibacterium halotolerans]
MTISVVGSINNDIVAVIDQYPKRGDTIFGKEIQYFPGGKGANQATAAARFEKHVRMIGAVGSDYYGENLMKSLDSSNVDTRFVKKSEKYATGTAIVAIDSTSENTMFVMKGANEDLLPEDVEPPFRETNDTSVLLVQMEVPQETVIRSMQLAKERNIYTILDPAPAEGITVKALEYADIITPNRQETYHMLGIDVVNVDTAVHAARTFESMGVKNSIIKMADQGSVVYQNGDWQHIPAISVEAVDSVGAGDAFAGTLACCMEEGIDLVKAARFATAVGALKVTKVGAQVGIPYKEEVREFCSQLGEEYVLDKESAFERGFSG